MLVASLRDVIRKQSEEAEALQRGLKEATAAHAKEVRSADRPISDCPLPMITSRTLLLIPRFSLFQVSDLKGQLQTISSHVQASDDKRKELEKEQEDLLVLLDEITNKRKSDKAKMRDAGLEVSDDEDDDEDE